MIDIVKKTSGDCDGEEMDSSLETFCSLTPLQSYLAMYGVMIGGMEISSLEGSSALVSLLFVAASFCGVIVSREISLLLHVHLDDINLTHCFPCRRGLGKACCQEYK